MNRAKDDYISDIINDFSDEIGNMLADLETNIQNAIADNSTYIDVDNFIFELKKADMYTRELEDFINNYRRYF